MFALPLVSINTHNSDTVELLKRIGKLIKLKKLKKLNNNIFLTNGINFACGVKSLRGPHDNSLVREINRRDSLRYNFLTNRCNLLNRIKRTSIIDKKKKVFLGLVG
ncbi:hypothetical protein BpHYR1_031358 [Brachionus plicatilis]|uniref:RNA-directed DNA polymerase from mobile element jockey-like n=1 Tax=Brachionus plicatilis TaxID=10195 RepID=A0A3M7R056_BRAPC|nr:hypothetical protein BpHYR1_031358 [Brachionus plicatilis]